MTSPIDTIRDGLAYLDLDNPLRRKTLAALTEVEQQLAAAERVSEARLAAMWGTGDSRDDWKRMAHAVAIERDEALRRAVAAETALADDRSHIFQLQAQEAVAAAEASEQRANELQERLRSNHDDVRKASERAERAYRERDEAWFEERHGRDAANNPTTYVWCRRCGTNHQRPAHCPARAALDRQEQT